MARGVHQRHDPVPQGNHRLLGKNRNSPRPLQLIGIQISVPVIDTPLLSDLPRQKKNRFRKRRLPRVHVGQQTRTYMF